MNGAEEPDPLLQRVRVTVVPGGPPPATGTKEPPRAAPPMLGRQLAIDAAVRWLVIFVLVAAMLTVCIFWDSLPPLMSNIAAVITAGLWIMWGSYNARGLREIPRISMLLEQDPERAEEAINAALGKRPLTRSARMLLYHRLAVLRYRQHRLPEVAAICRAMLSRRLGAAGGVRGNLLLMLTEAELEARHLPGAYSALMRLRRMKLPLIESLQRLALQTRYEIACGYHLNAIQGLPQKIKMVELMPGPQCGQMHALLAIAAGGARQPQLADWLRRRAELLCTPQQLADVAG